MLVEHRRHRPQVDPTAWIAPNAMISGNVVIGSGVRILYGAVLTAEGRLPLSVGRDCVIMEQAVLRSAGRWALELGDYVLVGPHAYLRTWGRPRIEVMPEAMTRYSRALEAHRNDRILAEESPRRGYNHLNP